MKCKLYLIITVAFMTLSISTLANADTNSDLSNDLNQYAQTNEKADFTKATVKGKTITVTVDNSYVESPVEEMGRESLFAKAEEYRRSLELSSNDTFN